MIKTSTSLDLGYTNFSKLTLKIKFLRFLKDAWQTIQKITNIVHRNFFKAPLKHESHTDINNYIFS